MPSVSKKQRRFFGLVKAVQEGRISPSEVGPSARRAAREVSREDVNDFARTPEKGLPQRARRRRRRKSLRELFGGR